MDAHGVVFEMSHGAPHVRVFRGGVDGNARFQASPAARLDQAEDRDQQGAGPDQDELQNFVKDGGAQTAERDVDRHGERRNPDADVDIPSQNDLQYQGHRVHVDAAHQHGHERKTDGGERAAGFSKAQLQVAGNRMRFGNVIERHHHQREEQHRRDGTDPIPVRGQNAVLIGRAGPAHQFERTQIGGEETQTRDPRGHLPPGHEKVFAGVGPLLQVKPDGQHQYEVKNDNHQINGG